MAGKNDIGSRVAGKAATPEVGGALRFLVGLHHARPRATASMARPSSFPLELRRRAGTVTIAPGFPPGLSFAMGLSPHLAAWAATGSGNGPAQAAMRPTPAEAPLIWSMGTSARSSLAATVRSPFAATALVARPLGTQGAEAPTARPTSAALPAVSWERAAVTGTETATTYSPAAMADPGIVRLVDSALPPVVHGVVGGQEQEPRSLDSTPADARTGAPPELRSISAARARAAAVAPMWWSLQASVPGLRAGLALPPVAAAPPRAPPGYTLPAMILPVRPALPARRPEAQRSSSDLPGPAASPGDRDVASPLLVLAPSLPSALAPATGAEGDLSTDAGPAPLAPSALVERRNAGGALGALPVLAAPLRRWVAGEVTQQVARATERRPPPAPPLQAAPIDVGSDDFVRRLMTKMRTLAQEERFRGGLLR
jgi:hypothetical protein